MTVSFEIKKVFKVADRGIFFTARLINKEANFRLTKNSRIGNIEVIEWFDIPRSVDKDGKQRKDLFIFQIKNEVDKNKLKEGLIVDLTNDSQ